MVKELNHYYKTASALWEEDFDFHGFEWIDFADTQNSVISYKRKSKSQDLICVHNFTPEYHQEYILYTEGIQTIKEVFNSDALKYGGSGKENHHPHVIRDQFGKSFAFKIVVAPLATMIFEPTY